MTIALNQLSNTQTFGSWLQRTNDICYVISTNTVTADSSLGGSMTTGNSFVNGYFGISRLFVNTALSGGNLTTNAVLSVTSNLSVVNATAFFGNSTANVVLGYLNAPSAIAQFYGNQNNYVQVAIQNTNNQVSSSTDISIYNDDPSLNTWLDIGISSSNWSNTLWTIGGGGDAYMYTSNGGLVIGTQNNFPIRIFANGTLATNEVIRVTAGANVGIGNTAPNAKFVVTGTSNISGNVAIGGTIIVSNTAAVTGNVTFSNTLLTTGNVTFQNTLSVTGNSTVSNIFPSTNNSYTIGNTTYVYSNVFTTNTYTNSISTGNSSPLTVNSNTNVNGYVAINDISRFYSNTFTFSSTSLQTVDSFAVSDFRSAEYFVELTDSTNYHLTKLLVLHDGTSSYVTEFGTLINNITLATFSADVNSGNLRLRAAPSTGTVVAKFTRTTLAV